MFIFRIKDNRLAMDVAILRALLALAAVASLFYRTTNPFYINIAASVILFSLSIFVRMLLTKYNIRPLLLAGVAAVLFFIATLSAGFAIVLLIVGMLPTFFYKTPLVEVGNEKIIVKRMIGASEYEWESFSNIILKDNLLTLDFKNNKVLQLEIDEKTAIDGTTFNSFCAGKIIQ
jgi:predicted PurR-regulated permease PerM